MSNAGQIGLAIVGGFIGGIIGGPAGAAYGLQIGLAVGSIVSPTQLPGTFGPKLTDKRTTTAQLGTPIAEVFGTDVVGGTVIWLGDVIEIATEEEVGGKGGPEGTSTTYTYTQSIAIGLCRGPVQGLQRIWENGKLVYDARDIQEGEADADYAERISATVEYAQKFTLYLGGEEQEPDPTIELKEGVGNVPAYRGLMYIVYTDRLLQAEQALRHPSFKFEVTNVPIVLPPPPPVYAHVPLYIYAAVVRHDPHDDFEFSGYSSLPYVTGDSGIQPEPFGSLGTADNPNFPFYAPYNEFSNTVGATDHIRALFISSVDSDVGGAGYGVGLSLSLEIDIGPAAFQHMRLYNSVGTLLGTYFATGHMVGDDSGRHFQWAADGLYFTEGEVITVIFYPQNVVLIP